MRENWLSTFIDIIWEIGRGHSLLLYDVLNAIIFVVSFAIISVLLKKFPRSPEKLNKIYVFLLLGLPLMYVSHGMMFSIYYFFSLITPYDFSFNGCWHANPEEVGLDKCFYLFPSTSLEIAMMQGKWVSAPLIGLVFFLLYNKNRDRD